MANRSYKTSRFLCHVRLHPLIPALRREFSEAGCVDTGSYVMALEREILRLRALLEKRP